MLAVVPTALAAVSWDPTIRGVLTVLVGVVVLVGSIWLIASTNTGARLGTLITLTGLFGWLFIMGLIWWIYGIGWVGDAPTWQTVDINRGDLSASVVEEATELPDRADLVDEYGTAWEIVQESGDETAIEEFSPQLGEDQTAGLTDEEIAELEADQQLRAELTTYSDVAAVAPEVLEEAGMEFGAWNLLSTAEAGEAQAQASADLIEQGIFADDGEFLFLDTYDRGGKDRLPEDPTRWDRISLTIENALQLTHPTRYAVVQVREVIEQEPEVGEAPPRPIPDEDEPVISVIMVRDIGDRRLPPALFTIGSLLIFLTLAYMLHHRDKTLTEHQAAFEAEKDS